MNFHNKLENKNSATEDTEGTERLLPGNFFRTFIEKYRLKFVVFSVISVFSAAKLIFPG